MEDLLKYAIKGDIEAFMQLMELIENDLYKIAKMRFSCDDDISDVMQETIIAAFFSLWRLKEPKYFKTWIIKILINKCNKHYKKFIKNNYIPYDNIDTYISDDKESARDSIIDFNFLMKHLNYNERIALQLYYNNHYTTKEIAKILEVSENTIKSRILRAREKIEEKMKEEVEL